MGISYQALAECVTSWLTYKYYTALKSVITEATLSVPITEYLNSNISSGSVEREKHHPNFRSRARGRPKSIDFVLKRGGGEGWIAAIETKYCPSDKKALVTDLLRMAYLRVGNGGCDRYILIAVKRTKKKQRLCLLYNSGGGREDLFDYFFGEGRCGSVVDLRVAPNTIHEYLSSFQRDYKMSDMCSVIVTEMVGSSKSTEFLTVVWRINRRQGAVMHNFLEK